jgi:hypothetical protein
MNTQYNKAVYTALVGSGITIASLCLNQFAHIQLGDPLVAALNTFAMALVTLFVPNASA